MTVSLYRIIFPRKFIHLWSSAFNYSDESKNISTILYFNQSFFKFRHQVIALLVFFLNISFFLIFFFIHFSHYFINAFNFVSLVMVNLVQIFPFNWSNEVFSSKNLFMKQQKNCRYESTYAIFNKRLFSCCINFCRWFIVQ